MAVLGLCGHAALSILGFYEGQEPDQPLGLYFLGKSLYCAGSLILASAFLEEVRGLRADAVRARLVVSSTVRLDPIERVVGLQLVGWLVAVLPLSICVFSALVEFNLFGLSNTGGGVLSWYYLGKGLYCFQALVLTHATLRELREFRGPIRMKEEP